MSISRRLFSLAAVLIVGNDSTQLARLGLHNGAPNDRTKRGVDVDTMMLAYRIALPKP